MHLGFHCNSQPVGGTPVSTEEVVPVNRKYNFSIHEDFQLCSFYILSCILVTRCTVFSSAFASIAAYLLLTDLVLFLWSLSLVHMHAHTHSHS